MKELCFIVAFFSMVPFLFAQADAPEKPEKKQMKPALLVIDIQNRYLPRMSEGDKDLALNLINGSIWLFRQHGLPIIRVYHTDPEWGPQPDEEDFQFPSSIIIKDDDTKVVKNYPSAFKKTELEKILREKDINTLFLCGLSAVGCVLATYHGAMDLDFNVFMIKDAILSHKAEYTDFVEEIFDVVSFTTLRFMLDHM
ncbi:MAG: isochorismatase family protein [candidate division WOR-3 bacterium]|nr:MAG: isochorismatase family protein [candidate division WOR-3 bacterium]